MIILYNHTLTYYFMISKILDISFLLVFAIIIQYATNICKLIFMHVSYYFLAGVMTLFKLVSFYYIVFEKKPTDDFLNSF